MAFRSPLARTRPLGGGARKRLDPAPHEEKGEARDMIRKGVLAGALVLAILLFGGMAGADTSQDEIEEVVALDNDSVRVALLTFPPGSASGEHVNPEPELGIILEGELTIVTPNGQEVLTAGTVRWLPALTPHDARNEGDHPVKLWALLLKRRN